MGFQVLIDILGSAIIGGILLLTLLDMKAANTENTYRYSGNQILQSNLISLTEMLDNDFKQIGFGRDSSWSNRLVIASKNRLRFFTDYDANGVKDYIEYNFSGADNTTPNPNDLVLSRIVNGVTTNYSFGVVNFDFIYRNISGGTVTNTTTQNDRNSINSIQIDVKMQSTYIFKRSDVSDPVYEYNKETEAWRRLYFPYKSRLR